VKVVIHKVRLSNIYNIEKYNKEIGGKFGQIISKIGKNRKFHIVNIDTESEFEFFSFQTIPNLTYFYVV